MEVPYIDESIETINLSEELLKKELINLKVESAPGPDKISAIVLKTCVNELLKPLLYIMQLSLTKSTLPTDWLKATVTAVYKKGDKTIASNYRPISLTAICCKVLERIVCQQIRDFVLELKIIPSAQHGFLPGRSVVTCHLQALNTWISELDKQNPIDVLYLDFEKAFDRVPHKRLLFKLNHFGIRGELLKWIESFLSNRTFCVTVESVQSVECKVLSGVPQGSVLGPLLFILYISDLSYLLVSKHGLYADDTKLYGSSVTDSINLQTDLDQIYNWSTNWLIPLNTEKCTVLHLGKNNPRKNYFINKNKVKAVDYQNDLGLIVTQDLTWSRHIGYITKRANSLSYLLFKTFSRPNKEIFLKLFKSYIRPLIEHAAVVWSPYLKRDIDLLERVQRRATKRVHSLRRLPYERRLQKLGLMTLVKRRRRGDLIWNFKIINNDNYSYLKNTLITIDENKKCRGHKYKLKKISFRTNIKKYFFPSRIFDDWNGLSGETVESTSLNNFKNKIDSSVLRYITRN